jgi:hypothetical protein
MERSVATKPDDDELELTPDMEIDPETPDEERDPDADPDTEVNHEDEQTIVAFEGEEPAEPEPENSVIRQIRAELKEERRRRIEAEKAAAPKEIEIGEKPTMASCEFDEERYEAELDAYKERKAAADRQTETQAEQSRKANEAWQQDLAAFEAKKTGLEFEDRDEAIETVTASLPTQWHLPAIVKAAQDPALFLYALSKSPAKQAEIAKIEDPIKLAAAVARMEGAVKVTKGRKAPEPDRPLTGSGRMPSGPDKELEKLEKEAERNGGDRTKVIAYKAKLASAAKGK